ncbi:MAG: ABC transporter ATP-binding protein [Flavobacteriales bacterium]
MKELSHLNKYFLKYKWHLLFGLIFIVATNYFKVYAPQLVREGLGYVKSALQSLEDPTLDPATLPRSVITLNDYGITEFNELPSGTSKETTNQFIIRISITLGLLFGVLYFMQGIFLFLTRVSIIIMSRRIEYDLKNEIFSHYQKLSLSFFKRNSTGDLMNRISEDVSKVRMYLGPAVMYTLNLIFLFSFVLYEMLNVSVKLTLYTLLPLPILSISIYYVSTLINKKSDAVQKQQSDLSTFAQESTSGVRVLKAYNREKAYMDTFTESSDDYKSKKLSLVKVEALFMPLIVLLVGLSTVLAIYLGGIDALDPNIPFEEEDIFLFVIYVNFLTWPFASVGWVTSLVNKAEASQKRINEFLKSKPEIVSDNEDTPPINGDIEFSNVSFIYPDTGITALKNVSFRIPQGKTLGITGRTGSGKSTIVNLISRQYDPTDGSVSMDDTPLNFMNLENLRSNIGTVPQDVFLFSDSIRNNIAFSGEEISEEEIIQAAKDADIYENIMDFPDKFDTILGERGINLSGGQKQRISIARAIIKNPSVLIFDDCLSAVDTETEEKILSSLKRIMKGKTSVIISHRVSSILLADHILVLEKGEIAEQGSHEELLEQKGYYAELYQKQLVEE